ncbi:cytosine deaminase [Paenibacillus phyllosphaerae]|uniref:Cytosine deaminase n=1 Tax=Paenibacillus phyllosphaerae TaxID=274593 RepID=A0A7W5FQY8_9BACL|nr:amidohydrolase family protein [Paenibacillus phyllosphaerae]MBB3113803.1 cytosine deaminase [Paenibacillus phyllosphaerae]
MWDVRITNARLQGRSGLFAIGVQDGLIASVLPQGQSPEADAARTLYDAGGGMLLPGLIEPHIHLEKALLLSRMEEDAASLKDAIRMTAAMKYGFTRADMAARSLYVIREAVKNGVTHMRCHAEVDPILGLSAFETMMELKEKVCDVLDLQVVVFPQEGIFQSPGTAELMEEALRIGGDVVGGITYQDPSLEDHLDVVFRLAEKYGKPIDFHADFSDRSEDAAILDIADRTIAAGMQGLVAAGHVTSLGSMERKRAETAARRIGEADLQIMTLPATDLFINGRGDRERPRRGLTPVKLLQEHGVNVVIGVNNVRNPFTPFGKADPLETAWLLAVTAYMGGDEDAKQLIHMLTGGAAKALGIQQYGLEPGAVADMVLFPEVSERAILLGKPEQRTVWKRGRMTAETKLQTRMDHIVLH